MVRCNKFTCQVCESKRLKKHLYMTDCNKKMCHECLFTNIIKYCSLKCPFCRVEYDFLKLSKYVEDKKIPHKLKSINDNLFKSTFKDSINVDEVLKKFNDNTLLCLKIGSAVLDSQYVMLDDNVLNLYETFIKMLMSLPPFMVSIHKNKNIFLTLNKHYEEFKRCDNLNEVFDILGVNEVGLFDNDKPEYIEVYDIKKEKLIYELVGNDKQIKKTYDKLNRPQLNFNDLDSFEKYRQCKRYITSMTIIKQRQPKKQIKVDYTPILKKEEYTENSNLYMYSKVIERYENGQMSKEEFENIYSQIIMSYWGTKHFNDKFIILHNKASILLGHC